MTLKMPRCCHPDDRKDLAAFPGEKGLLGETKVNGAKARSSEELKFLSSQAALSYRAAVATDAHSASAQCGMLRFAQHDTKYRGSIYIIPLPPKIT